MPPGVVAVLKLRALDHAWLPIAAGILVSSVLTPVISGRIAQRLLARDAAVPDAAPVRQA